MAKIKASDVVKKILSAIPLDGSKTLIGLWLSLIGVVSHYLPGIDLMAVIQAIIANPTKAGITALVVGLVHKYLKARFPDAPNY